MIKMESSKIVYNGRVTRIKVSTSGGVIIAATSIIISNACLRYFDIWEELRILILARINAITGNWNTIPNRSVIDTKVEI